MREFIDEHRDVQGVEPICSTAKAKGWPADPSSDVMRRLVLRGVIRGKVVCTTISDPKAPCPLDLVNRQFIANGPNQL